MAELSEDLLLKDEDKKVLKLLSFALLFSQLMLVFIAYLRSTNSRGWIFGFNIQADNTIMIAGASLVGLSIFILSAFYLPAFFSSSFQERYPQITDITKGPIQNYKYSFHRSLCIIRMVTAESVTILGLVLAFSNKSFLFIVPFAAAGILLQFFVGPIFSEMYFKNKKEEQFYTN